MHAMEQSAVQAILDQKAARLRSYIASIEKSEKPLLSLAKSAADWFSLGEADRQALIEIIGLFSDDDEDDRIWFQRAGAQVLSPTEINIAKPIISRYIAASKALKAAVQTGLAEENNRRAAAEANMTSDRIQNEIKRGESEAKANRVTSFTEAEFLRRFTST